MTMTLIPTPSPTEDTVAVDDGSSAQAFLYLVGYDGTPPARRALSLAADLARDAHGHLEVVFVKHVPLAATLSMDGLIGERDALEELADLLEAETHVLLQDHATSHHFQRRSGSVAHELIKAASELVTQPGDHPAIAIVVGASAHRVHHVVGAVSAELTRRGTFPVLVA